MIRIDAINKSALSGDGGYGLDIMDLFSVVEKLRVYIGPTGTIKDPIAYSGKFISRQTFFASATGKVR